MYNRVERCCAELSSLLRTKREPELVLAPVRGGERFYAGLSSLLRTKREPEMVLAPVARGQSALSFRLIVLF